MVFSGIPFLFYYLPILLLVYFAVPASHRHARNLVLLIASLLFYAWGEGLYVLLLLFSITINHKIAQRLLTQNKTALIVGVIVNLGLLAWYKYAGFAAQSLGFNHWQAPPLPLGISFFTFQSISYLVDVYRKQAKPASSFIESALYISSFPQLIAGPIVRYKHVAEQIFSRTESFAQFNLGIRFFIIGLAQKVLIANLVGETADAAFGAVPQELNALAAWIGLLAYGLQIYFDFAGYSNMALGLGHMLGFKFPRNFDTPYSAQSITLFWRRWHMTLSEWFRDYLYIPLGGNRGGTAVTIFNLWLVFILCGLWHGAAWTFILWGAWHGLFLSIERVGLGRLLLRLWQPLRHLYLLVVVFLAWVLFRAESIRHALDYYAALFGLNSNSSDALPFLFNPQTAAMLALSLILATSLPSRFISLFKSTLSTKPFASMPSQTELTPALDSAFITSIYYLSLFAVFVLCVAALVSNTYNPFIYFRF